MGELGDTLARARQRQGLSIQQASEAIHINPGYLEALEEERLSIFPADVYARGFLRSYASYLGLDPQPLIDEFQALRRPAPAAAPSTRRKPQRRSAEPARPVAAEISRRYSGANASSLFPYTYQSLARERTQSSPALLLIPLLLLVVVFVAAEGRQYYTRAASFLGRGHRASVETPRRHPSPHRPPSMPQPAATSDAPLVLSLRSTGYVHLEVNTDLGSQHHFAGEWMPGDHQTWKGRKKISIYADRGYNLYAKLNGKDLGRLGPRGRKYWKDFHVEEQGANGKPAADGASPSSDGSKSSASTGGPTLPATGPTPGSATSHPSIAAGSPTPGSTGEAGTGNAH